jgi:hypothetical protein
LGGTVGLSKQRQQRGQRSDQAESCCIAPHKLLGTSISHSFDSSLFKNAAIIPELGRRVNERGDLSGLMNGQIRHVF